MAQIILTKNGTGSAYPAALSQGELAINVSSGSLYYGTSGSANAVSSSFVMHNLNLVKSGSTQGHLTASGNISASITSTGSFGRIELGPAGQAQASDQFYTHGNSHVNGTLHVDSTLYANAYCTIGSLLRANGGIAVDTNAFTVENATGHVVTAGNITAAGTITASQVYEGTYYQFEATAKGDTDDDDNWQGPNIYGIHTRADWNYDFGTDYDDITAVNAESRTLINTGWRIPHGANYSASVVNMDIYVTVNSNITHADNDNFSCSLWYSKASDMVTETNVVDASTGAFDQRHAATAISTQCKAADEALYKYNVYHVSASIGLDLAPGSILFPRIKTVGTNDFNTVFHWIVNYKKIPL